MLRYIVSQGDDDPDEAMASFFSFRVVYCTDTEYARTLKLNRFVLFYDESTFYNKSRTYRTELQSYIEKVPGTSIVKQRQDYQSQGPDQGQGR